MCFLDTEARGRQPLANFTRDQHAPVVSSGAAERNRQVTLALGDIDAESGTPSNSEMRSMNSRVMRKRADIARHPRMRARLQFVKRGMIIRIRQEAHIEHQVGIGGTPWRKPKLVTPTRRVRRASSGRTDPVADESISRSSCTLNLMVLIMTSARLANGLQALALARGCCR